MKDLNIGPINAVEAARRAKLSLMHAEKAFKFKLLLMIQEERLDYWTLVFIDSAVILLSCLFLISVIVEILFSLPMYLDIMSQLTGEANYYFALCGALLIVLFGASVSHYLAKTLDSALVDYAIVNRTRFRKTATLQSAVEEEVERIARRELVIGILLAVLLMIIVVGVSWQRVWLQGEINGGNYNLFHKLLPPFCVAVEIFSGIYVGYVIRRIRCINLKSKYSRGFRKEKEKCSEQTAMAIDFYHAAQKAGEDIHYSKALRDAIRRNDTLAFDDPAYVDPMPRENMVRVIVKDGESVVRDVTLQGVLPNGEYCGSALTNQYGEGILIWQGQQKELSAIVAGGELYEGPFLENSTTTIYIRRIKRIRPAK